ncbi:hypothetical protein HDV02_001008 [Globomyces sp. JEL0801]|nr:hypothetical protein HDV02_001008 [Globomyces sp. JEL0801]
MGFFGNSSSTKSLNNEAKDLPKPLPPPANLKSAKPIPPDMDNEDPLVVGIFYHEQGAYAISAYYFSIAAARGDPTGLFLYAVSMRHGWGTEKNEKEAFRLLSMVTDKVIGDEGFKNIGISTQMPLAIYEVGMSFLQGWGVEKNKIKAAYYFNIAAQLNDPDAQVAMAECYLRGDGVKASKKQAAYWFRKAEEQGTKLVQNQWIWKEKYND